MALNLVTLLLILTTAPLLISSQTTAPAPKSSSSLNITGILDKAGNFHQLILLLTSTRVDVQLDSQIQSSNVNGLTIICPTDNAFQKLKDGFINSLSQQKQVELLQYHVLPQYYSLQKFQTASNPLSTQAPYTFNVSTNSNQVNITTGNVTTTLGSALYNKLPLAMYPVEDVLLAPGMFEAKAPASSPAAKNGTAPKGAPSDDASSEGPAPNGVAGLKVGLWSLVVGLVFVAMGFGGN